MILCTCAMAVMISCKQNGQATSSNNSNDSLTTDTATEAGIDKHSGAYIRQRLDTIYGSIRKRVASGTYMGAGFNPDSAYCSSRYYGLLKQALDIADETGDIVLTTTIGYADRTFPKTGTIRSRKFTTSPILLPWPILLSSTSAIRKM